MKTGLHNLTMAEYLALPALSSGVAHTILAESPSHAKFAQMSERTASKEMDLGSIAHAVFLERDWKCVEVCQFNDWRKDAAKEMRDAARDAGKYPILEKDVPRIEAQVKAATEFVASSEIAGVMNSGQCEVTLVWTETCDAGEILCKARADHLTADRHICLSYKTTAGSANPDVWIRTQLPSYDMATVFYERAVLAACGVEETQCVHLIQEQSAPFACSLVALSPALTDLADRKLERAMSIWAGCQASGKYPAYPTRICYAEPKPWQIGEWDEQEDNRARLSADELAGGIPA